MTEHTGTDRFRSVPAIGMIDLGTDYQIFSHVKKFLRGKSFASDDEVIMTIEVYLKII